MPAFTDQSDKSSFNFQADTIHAALVVITKLINLATIDK
jgi:hypothetical protein